MRPARTDKKKILKAARGLLVRRGYRSVILDEVSRRAKVAKGTLYLYFRGSQIGRRARVFASSLPRFGGLRRGSVLLQ